MNILALDLATKCGWAYSTKRGIQHGTTDFHNKQWDGAGMRFLKLKALILNIGWVPDLVVYEKVERHTGGTYAAHVYGGFLAEMQVVCEEQEIPYTGYGVTEIKKFWTGKGNADKAAMIQAARERGFNPKDDNAADALAILHMALKEFSWD